MGFISLPFIFMVFVAQAPRDTIRAHYEAAEAKRRAGNLVAAETEYAAILAEGYDGRVATQSFTLPVQPPVYKSRPVHYAEILYRNDRIRSATSATAFSGI